MNTRRKSAKAAAAAAAAGPAAPQQQQPTQQNENTIILPSALQLCRANLMDPDPACRHLLLLTDGSAAMRLLYELNLVNPSRTTVVLASHFPRDVNSEVYLLQQINLVKRGMMRGDIVVLVNQNEALFPSLYDVLNQRAVIKRDVETGKSTRMLRLAVGKRSQWVPVRAGFKIVVVAEVEEAYKMDVPLLNRFEKQVLRAQDALLEAGDAEKCSKLKSWTEQVIKVSGVHDAFFGLYPQTIPSLVVSRRNATFVELQAELERLAAPLAILKSPEGLFPHHSKTQGEELNLVALLRREAEDITDATTRRPQCVIVITRSPTKSLEDVLLVPGGGSGGTSSSSSTSFMFPIIPLASLTSESSLIQALQKIKSAASPVVVMQTDPHQTSQALIHQALFVAQQYLPATKKLCLVVHAPPSSRSTLRRFNVDFSKEWRIYFMDDLTRSGRESVELANVPLLHYFAGKLLSSFREKLSHAIALSPYPPNSDRSPRQRAVALQQHLRDDVDKRFFHCLERIVQADLGKFSSTQIVDMVSSGDVQRGTLSDSLLLAFETTLTRALAHALSVLDVNFNTRLVDNPNGKYCDLWYELANNVAVIDLENLSDVFSKTFSGQRQVINTATSGSELVVCQCPWSWRIAEILTSAAQRFMATSPAGFTEASLQGVLQTTFGATLSNKLQGQAITTAYLTDLVASGERRVPAISLQEQTELVLGILLCENAHALDSIAAVHTTFLKCEHAVFAATSFRARLNPLLDFITTDSIRNEIIKSLQYSQLPRGVGLRAGGTAYLQMLASQVFRHKSCISAGTWWLRTVDATRPYAEALTEALPDDYLKILVTATYVQEFDCDPTAVPEQVITTNWSALKEYWSAGKFQDKKVRFLHRFLRIVFAKKLSELASSSQAVAAETQLKREIESVVTFCSEDVAAPLELRICALEILVRGAPVLANPILGKSSPLAETLLLDLAEDLYRDAGFHVCDETKQVVNVRALITECIIPRGGNHTAELAKIKPFMQHKSTRAFALNVLLSCLGTFHTADVLLHNAELTSMLAGKPVKNLKEVQTQTISNDTSVVFRGKVSHLPDLNPLVLTPALYKAAQDVLFKLKSNAYKMTSTTGGEILKSLMNSIAKKPQEFKLGPNPAKFALHSLPDTDRGKEMCSVLALLLNVGNFPPDVLNTQRNELVVFFKSIMATTEHLRTDGAENDKYMLSHIYEKFALTTCVQDPWVNILDQFDEWDRAGARLVILNIIAMTLICEDPDELSWMGDLLRVAPRLKDCFLPGMAPSLIHAIGSILGSVGWWECPNGHKYAVGECTQPMQIGRCPECKAEVGGQNHNPVNGVKKLGLADDIVGENKGFIPAELSDEAPLVRGTLTKGTAGFFKFVIYAMLLVSAHDDTKRTQRVKTFMNASQNWHKDLKVGMADGWKLVKKEAGGLTDPADSYLLLSGMVIIAGRGTNASPAPPAFSNSTKHLMQDKKEREKVEHVVKEQAWILLGSGNFNAMRKSIDEIRASVQSNQASGTILSVLGTEIMNEAERLQADKTDLYRYRVRCSFNELSAALDGNAISSFPLLREVVLNSKRLWKIRYIPDILDWLVVALDALKHHGITRADAREMTNIQVIDKFIHTPEQKARARTVLGKYCEAFNQAFPLVRMLLECQRNPFLSESGEIDLSGGQGKDPSTIAVMSFDTPICFSLPNIVQGDADASGLCVVMLLRNLQNLNNTLLDEFRKAKNITVATQDPVSIDMDTPRRNVESLLVSFEKEKDLQPLIAMYSGHAHGLGFGVPRKIALYEIENALGWLLLGGKSEIELIIPGFEYKGEKTSSTVMTAFMKKCPQVALEPSLIKALKRDLDTVVARQPLEEMLGVAISFLSNMAKVDAQTMFKTFCIEVLGIVEQRWEDSVPRPITDNVRLCHLAAFHEFLDEMKNGSLFDALHPKFKAEITPPDLYVEVANAAKKLDLAMLVPVFKNLLIREELTKDTWPADGSLAEYLGYATDLDLERVRGFEMFFPGRLKLAHVAEVYKVFTGRGG